MVPHAQEVIQWAKLHKGVHEDPKGSNDGPSLRQMLAATRFQHGQQWCMFFAEAAIKAGFDGHGPIPHWITLDGSCAHCADLAQQYGKLSEYPATGAIALFKGGPYGYHHAGIVLTIGEPYGHVITIEGNTDSTGGIHGGEVDIHTHWQHTAMYVIW